MKPNIILLTIDCLRYDRCGFNGFERDTTPTLDKLARSSVIFDAAVAPGPRTGESVPGLLAGRLSAETSFYDEIAFKAIPSEKPTIASWLRDQEYQTIAVLSNPQLTPIRNFDQGFDYFENLRIENRGDEFAPNGEKSKTNTVGGRLRSIRDRLRDPIRNRIQSGTSRSFDPANIAFILSRLVQKRKDWPTVPGADVITRLLSKLQQIDDDRPIFAWAHLNDLHAPLNPDRVRQGGLLNDVSDITQFRWDLHRIANRYEPGYAGMYESSLRYVDSQVERVESYLRSNDELDDTIIIVTADHGEALHDRGIYGHAAGHDRFLYDSSRDYMYEELLHVPLLVRIPNHEPTRVQSPFSLLWLHELFAEITDLEPGEFPQGSDRKSHLDPSNDEIVLADAISEKGAHYRRSKREYKASQPVSHR